MQGYTRPSHRSRASFKTSLSPFQPAFKPSHSLPPRAPGAIATTPQAVPIKIKPPVSLFSLQPALPYPFQPALPPPEEDFQSCVTEESGNDNDDRECAPARLPYPSLRTADDCAPDDTLDAADSIHESAREVHADVAEATLAPRSQRLLSSRLKHRISGLRFRGRHGQRAEEGGREGRPQHGRWQEATVILPLSPKT